MPERPQYLRDLDSARRADIQVGRSDAAYGKHTMSRPWQAYNQMQTMQNQANPDLDRLKAVRRDWNRNLKYTPAGMAVSGATTPMGAQDAFVRGTEDFRQRNKPAYNKMYPLTGMAMDYPSQGGLFGMIARGAGDLLGNLKGMGKDISDKVGITGAVDDTPEEQDDYVAKTFGFYPSDVHPGPTYYDRPDDLEDFEDDPNAPIKRIQEEVYGGPRPHEGMPTFPDIYRGPRPHQGLPPLDVYEGPRPHEGIPLPLGTAPIEDVEISDLPDEPLRVQKSDWVDDITETDTMPGSPFFPGNLLNLFNKDKEIPGYGTTYIDMEEPDERYEDYIERGEEPPAITPFDDSGRETGIASLYGQGPQWGSTNRRYEDEYRDHISRTGERMTYEEFERAWERVHQGKPHAGLR